MSAPWPMVRLAQVLSVSSEWTNIEPTRQYQEVTVRLWGKGVTERHTVAGSEIAARRRGIARAGQFILSRIDARNGALGLVPASLDGAVTSADFPTFDVNQSRLLPEFLTWLSRTDGFVEVCRKASEGTTNRVRLQEHRFLACEIPLPPLEEQRRIVGRLDQLAARIAEARQLRQASINEAASLTAGAEDVIWCGGQLHRAATLAEVTTYLARGRQSRQGDSSHYLIKTQHVQMGKYMKSVLSLAPDAAAKVTAEAVVRPGDILIACSAAGCLGRVAFCDETDRTASTDSHVAIARANAGVVLPEYLYAYLKSPQGQFQLRSRERGDWTREKVGFRLTELNLANLKEVPVPVPPLDQQRDIIVRVRALGGISEQLARFQSETERELSALLPAILDRAFKGEL